METARPPGRIVTFYSYKGGTGRSMALANVAWVLASQGKRVLVVDWDLEAPGLHRYFQPFLVDRDLTASDGVIDFVIDYALETVSQAPGGGEVPPDWYRRHADIVRYAASLEWEDWEFPRGGTIDFVGAGRQGPSYSHRVNTFDWSGFYDRQGGGAFLEAVRERMRAEYDYVLIDSRTGVSDTSGICTVQLPDDLVLCFTLNNQSIEGAAAVVAAVQAQRSDGIRIFPVPMRVELAEKDKLEARRAHARIRLGMLPGHLDPARLDAYWSAAEVLYVPYYAYEEVLAPFGDRVGTLTSLLGSMERLTAGLTDGEVERSEPVPETMRQEVLAAYARRGGGMPEDEPSRAAETAWLRLSPEAQETARRAFTRMVRLARPDEGGAASPARLPLSDVPGARLAVAPFVTLGLVAIELDPAMSEEVVYWAAPQVIERWPRLRGWIEEERPFLLWRQKLRADLADWEGN
ncbi:MAG TPA: AAA family ATPase, partial [Thermoanaerobaculia bacterium]|nr:AAA family ATPase [Thermoanaerobaculia bacterium]